LGPSKGRGPGASVSTQPARKRAAVKTRTSEPFERGLDQRNEEERDILESGVTVKKDLKRNYQ